MSDHAVFGVLNQGLRVDEHVRRRDGLVGEQGGQVLVFKRLLPLIHGRDPQAGDDLLGDREQLRVPGLLLNHGVELVNGLHVVVLQELAELLGALDILDDLIVVVEMVLVAIQGRKERLRALRLFAKPPQEPVERRAIVLRDALVIGVFVDRCRYFLDHEPLVFLGETVKVRDDLRGEEFLAQVGAQQFEDVQEDGVDIAGIKREFTLLLEAAVLIWEDCPLGDDREEIRLAELHGSVELIEPRVGLLSLQLRRERCD